VRTFFSEGRLPRLSKLLLRPASGWTQYRTLPEPRPKAFRQLWKGRPGAGDK
jgi:hypothetical protein